MSDFQYTIESEIHCDRQTLWHHITQMKNVNAELMPYVRMTYPENKSEIGNNEIPMHETLFRSLVLLFGFIPADVHYLRLDRIDNGNAFYENSITAMHRYWKHTRTITERNGKTFLQDEIHFLPRIYPTGYLLLPLIKIIFENRHKNLKKFFNG